MSKADINQSIEALRAELDKVATTDIAAKDKLLALITDVERQLQEPDKEVDSEGSRKATLQQLPALIEQFEADHPKVTNTLGRLLNTLSSMGI
ncbi:hypothetical protein S7335_1410 [Synechococcus sp. PCC 7335]|uniref:DUF4404 family protein n=1 Tax=Synechococcus sp. (strain ATCC 29403 / PCC 7335) TaxID=91464 RepID=UPI00017ECB46|nr:DUF4404 family protein [Synechococcus sp. PCC 7335]EDX83713.1 hypothetical protein S7335_1410 [Synechococcus sp. PCC 7335]